jgi:hypothetical protein
MKEYYSFKIPEPCNEDWNQMTPSAKGRFCSSCEKTVIDFTEMSSFEISNYLKENIHNGVCGHINKSQLDRVVLKVPVSTIHQLRFSSRFFAIALLVVMGTTLMSCKDQYGNKKKIDSVEIVDSLETNQMLLGVMAPPKSLLDTISQNELIKADCDANAIKYKDSIDEEIPITGGFGAPPVPPVIDVATTGEIVTVEGAMVLEDRYSNEVPFALVQNAPQFPNTPIGMKRNEGKKYFSDSMNQHISANFNKKVLDTTILGRHRISTQFKIDTNGQIIDIKVKAKYKVLEAEVLRVLESLPQLVPGKDDDNNKVAVTYVLPIIFEND